MLMVEAMSNDRLAAARASAYEGPRPEVQALVPLDARRVLDLGCSSGAVGAALKGRQDAEVIGVEVDPRYATEAERRLDRVVVADLERLAASKDLEANLGCFDCLIAADVLEHLRDPWSALDRFASLLKPQGAAVVSLPNVRYWETYWEIGVRGTFPRRAKGIFDRTHLRWFTLRDAYSLLDQAGLDVHRISHQVRLRPGSTRWDRHAHWLSRTPLGTFITFQYIILARRRP
jgi:2-polyprenyl-3-methyl-5-hydroxy-6-metoxy-1,4-benzoquinol methylase